MQTCVLLEKGRSRHVRCLLLISAHYTCYHNIMCIHNCVLMAGIDTNAIPLPRWLFAFFLCIPSFVYPFIQSFIHPLIHSFSHSVIHSFIDSFIHSCIPLVGRCTHRTLPNLRCSLPNFCFWSSLADKTDPEDLHSLPRGVAPASWPKQNISNPGCPSLTVYTHERTYQRHTREIHKPAPTPVHCTGTTFTIAWYRLHV